MCCMYSVLVGNLSISSIALKHNTCAQVEVWIWSAWSNSSISFMNFSSPYSKRWPKTSWQMMLETALLMMRCGFTGFPSEFSRKMSSKLSSWPLWNCLWMLNGYLYSLGSLPRNVWIHPGWQAQETSSRTQSIWGLKEQSVSAVSRCFHYWI